MKVIASKDSTWDMLAYNAGYSEFQMDVIMSENSFEYSDVVTFDGGEVVSISSVNIVDEATLKAPWEA